MDTSTTLPIKGHQGLLEIMGLTVFTVIGVHAFEKKIKQKIVLDLHIPLKTISHEDRIEEVIDYSLLCAEVTAFIEQQSVDLIETLVSMVSSFLKKRYQLECLTVKISKPFAVSNAQNVSITHYDGF